MEKIKEVIYKYKNIILISIIGIILSIFLLFFILINWKTKTEEDVDLDILEELLLEDEIGETEMKDEFEDMSDDSDNNIETKNINQEIMVDIKGAVNNPGVYQLIEHNRIIDAIELAGGLISDADENAINLAQIVTDQMVIYVPTKNEDINEVVYYQTEATEQFDDGEEQVEKIDLNTADKSKLMTLSGIGDVKADNIISYREENGVFQSIEEIKNVSGIGDSTYEKLKNQLYITN